MSYFDSKQEVLNITLTSHGREMLLKGKFKPAYYSFHDDDVLYDSSYGSVQENNVETSNRILENTPYLKPNGRKKSVEEIIKTKGNAELYDRDIYEMSSLGLASIGNQNAPAWSVKMLGGTIASTQKTYSHPVIGTINIPQINVQPIFTKIKLVKQSELTPSYNHIIFEDGNAIDIIPDGFSVEVEELNVDSKDTNFNFEIYEVLEENGKEILKHIPFEKQFTNIKNNILLDIEEPLEIYSEVKTAEKCFNFLVDDEVATIESRAAADVTDISRPMKKGLFGEDC